MKKNDIANNSFGNIKKFCKESLRIFSARIKSSNFFNFLPCQFGIPHLFPSKFFAQHSISHVIQMRTNVKMGDSYTRSVFAFMKNVFSFWNFSVFKNPRNAVSENFFSKTHSSISIKSKAIPNPTMRGFCDLRKKSFSRVYPISMMIGFSHIAIGFLCVTILASFSIAACPQFTYPENHKLDAEVNNICDNILNPIINNETVQSETVKSLTVSSMTVSSFTATNGTFTAKLTVPNGSSATDAAAFGQLHLMQIPVYCVATSVFTTTSTSYQTSNLSCTITPASSVSHVLVMTHIVCNGAAGGSDVSIFRGSTDLGSGSANGFEFLGNNQRFPMAAFVLDSPNTTSATTYSVKIKNDSGASTSSAGITGEIQTMALLEVQ